MRRKNTHSIKQMKTRKCTTTIIEEKLQFFVVWFSKNRFPFNVRENCNFIEQLYSASFQFPEH